MFKKILLFALASLMLLACAKVSEPTEKLVTVTFCTRHHSEALVLPLAWGFQLSRKAR